MDLGRPLHDREAQPADGVATGLLGAAIEAVEDPLAVDGRDATAAVGHDQAVRVSLRSD